MSEQEQYEEWTAMPLSERMRSEIAMASAYADEVAALEAKLEAMELAGNQLLRILPDSLFYERVDGDQSWGWCWNELSGRAQDLVKQARETWVTAAQQEQEDE